MVIGFIGTGHIVKDRGMGRPLCSTTAHYWESEVGEIPLEMACPDCRRQYKRLLTLAKPTLLKMRQGWILSFQGGKPIVFYWDFEKEERTSYRLRADVYSFLHGQKFLNRGEVLRPMEDSSPIHYGLSDTGKALVEHEYYEGLIFKLAKEHGATNIEINSRLVKTSVTITYGPPEGQQYPYSVYHCDALTITEAYGKVKADLGVS